MMDLFGLRLLFSSSISSNWRSIHTISYAKSIIAYPKFLKEKSGKPNFWHNNVKGSWLKIGVDKSVVAAEADDWTGRASADALLTYSR